MYPRNAVSPERIAVGQVVLIANGTVQSTGVAVTVRGQGGAEAAGVGTIAYGADNTVYYTPTQAETNFTSFVVIAYKAACFSCSQTVITTASVTPGQVRLEGVTHTGAVIPTVSALTGHTAQTGDTFALANGANGFVATKADTAAILSDTAEIGVAGAGLTDVTLNAASIDLIWDEPVAAHQTALTMGRGVSLGGVSVAETTAAGTPTTTNIQLTAGSAIDNFYVDQTFRVLSGAGLGQARIITSYTGATKTCIFDEPFITAPAPGDAVDIVMDHTHPVTQIRAEIDANSTQLAAIKADSAAILIDTAKPVKNAIFADIPIEMVLATDHVSPATGLTLAVARSIDGGAFGAATGTAAEVGNGLYMFDASAADMNGDSVTFRFTAATADDSMVSVFTRA